MGPRGRHGCRGARYAKAGAGRKEQGRDPHRLVRDMHKAKHEVQAAVAAVIQLAQASDRFAPAKIFRHRPAAAAD